jgi:type II secretory pathway component PulF
MDNFENSIIPEVESITWTVSTDVSWWDKILVEILKFINESIFSLLAVIAIWAFIYIWFMLVKADWNPEDMKKAFMNLIYVIIWLFIVWVSWVLVKMVSGINF